MTSWATNWFGFVISIGRFGWLVIETFGAIFKRPPSWNLVRDQLYHIGVQSLPVIAVTGFSTGLILATQAYYQLSDWGLDGTVGLMVGKSMMTELGPVLTALMVTGRVGAAMCAELGTMRVSEQIDALHSMSVNPLRYLVAPRVIAGTTMLAPLTIFSTITGIVGGYLITVYYFGMSPNTYLDPLPESLTNWDFMTGLIKAFVFGAIITTICCYKGLTTRGGAAGVGQSTTASVVISYSIILVANFLLNILLNNLHEAYFPWL
jgi:phospholipid/cholesterol/gamma-HCH transport system permease protein